MALILSVQILFAMVIFSVTGTKEEFYKEMQELLEKQLRSKLPEELPLPDVNTCFSETCLKMSNGKITDIQQFQISETPEIQLKPINPGYKLIMLFFELKFDILKMKFEQFSIEVKDQTQDSPEPEEWTSESTSSVVRVVMEVRGCVGFVDKVEFVQLEGFETCPTCRVPEVTGDTMGRINNVIVYEAKLTINHALKTALKQTKMFSIFENRCEILEEDDVSVSTETKKRAWWKRIIGRRTV